MSQVSTISRHSLQAHPCDVSHKGKAEKTNTNSYTLYANCMQMLSTCSKAASADRSASNLTSTEILLVHSSAWDVWNGEKACELFWNQTSHQMFGIFPRHLQWNIDLERLASGAKTYKKTKCSKVFQAISSASSAAASSSSCPAQDHWKGNLETPT